MNTSTILKALVAGSLALGTAASAFADNQMNDAKEKGRGMLANPDSSATALVSDSASVYRALLKGPHGTVPESVLKNAKCVVVVPNLITAAAVVGGAHGDGVASCRTQDAKWSGPAFVDFNAGSIGAQLGAKSTGLVMYFTNSQAAEILKQGKFEIGADASVVAGQFDRAFDTSSAGVVAYQDNAGAFLGVAVGGGSISADDEASAAYYGHPVKQSAILGGNATQLSARTDDFTKLLP